LLGNNPNCYFSTINVFRTIFDIDIESFEEKPWRHPGVDITDYFNFGLDEDKWKAYCKQLASYNLFVNMYLGRETHPYFCNLGFNISICRINSV